MALRDRQTLLSDAQAVTATAFSVDQYDTGNMGAGNPARNLGRDFADLRAVFTVGAAATAAGAATVNFEIGSADDAAGTNFTPHAQSGPIAIANLTAGAVPFDVALPDHTRRFVMARYTVATGPLTGGTFSCALQIGSDFQRGYRRGDNASAY